MNSMVIETRDRRTAFRPGETIEGIVRWQLDRRCRRAELRLFWYTEGRVMQDVSVEEMIAFDAPKASDSRDFAIRLPEGPYSFSGSLFSVRWALELIVRSGGVERLPLVVGPGAREINAQRPPGGPGGNTQSMQR